MLVTDHDLRVELQERAVALVCLDDDPLAAVPHHVGADLVDVASDEEARAQPRLDQDQGQHGGGRGLAVGPRHRDAPSAPIAASAWARLSSTQAPPACLGGPRDSTSGRRWTAPTTSASATWTASWPTKTLTPLAANRSTAGELLRSLPVRGGPWPRAPRRWRSSPRRRPPRRAPVGAGKGPGGRERPTPRYAPHSPAPLGADGSRSEGMGRLGSPVRGAGMVPGQADHGRHGVGAPHRAGRQAHGPEPARVGHRPRRSPGRDASGLHWESGTDRTAAPARSRTAALAC